MYIPKRARLRSTIIRLQSFTKGVWLFASITSEIITMSASSPWKLSTVDNRTESLGSNFLKSLFWIIWLRISSSWPLYGVRIAIDAFGTPQQTKYIVSFTAISDSLLFTLDKPFCDIVWLPLWVQKKIWGSTPGISLPLPAQFFSWLNVRLVP